MVRIESVERSAAIASLLDGGTAPATAGEDGDGEEGQLESPPSTAPRPQGRQAPFPRQGSSEPSPMRLADADYAIVESGGKQYRAEKGASLVVDRLPADEGAKVSLRPVMSAPTRRSSLDGKDLEKVKVEAVVAGHVRGPKIGSSSTRPRRATGAAPATARS